MANKVITTLIGGAIGSLFGPGGTVVGAGLGFAAGDKSPEPTPSESRELKRMALYKTTENPAFLDMSDKEFDAWD